MAALGKLVASLGLESAEFTGGLTKAEYQLKKFTQATEAATTSALRGFAAQLFALDTAINLVSKQIDGLTNAVKGLDRLDEMAQKTGASVEELSKLEKVALETGESFDGIEGALIKLTKGLAGADEETKGAAQALKFLGINARDAAGNLRDPAALTQEIAKKLSEFGDSAGKTAIALDLFGKSGAAMLPYLKDLGSAGDIAATATAKQAEEAAKLKDSIAALGAQYELAKRRLASELIPAMTAVIETMINIKKQEDALKSNNGVSDWAFSGARALATFADTMLTFLERLKGLGQEVVGVANLAGAAFDRLAAGAATAVARATGSGSILGDAIQLEQRANERYTRALEAFAKGGELSSTTLRKYSTELERNIALQGAANGAFTDARDRMAGFGGSTEKAAGELAKYSGAVAKAGKDTDDLAKLLEKLDAKDGGVDASFAKDVATLEAAQRKGVITIDRYAKAMETLINLQPGVVALKKAQDDLAKEGAKLFAEAEKEVEKYYETLLKSTIAIEDNAKKVADEVESYGKLPSEIARANVRRAEEAVLLAKVAGESDDVIKNLERQVKAYQDIANSTQVLENYKAQEEALQKQKSAWESLEQAAQGFFEDLLQNGRSAFGNLWDTIKRFFAQVAAQFATKFVLNTVLGIGGSGGGGIGSILGSVLGGNGGILGSIGGLLGGAGASVGGVLGTLFSGSSAIGGAAGSLAGMIPGVGAAGAGGLLGSIAPFLGPLAIVAGIGALISSFIKDEKGFKFDNSLLNVAAAPANVQQSALGAFAPSGDVDGKLLSAITPFIQAVQTIDKAIVDNFLTDETLAMVQQRIQALQNPRWWNLEDKDAVEKASKFFLQQRYSTAFADIDSEIAQRISSFSGTADELLQFISRAVAVKQALDNIADVLPDLNLSLSDFVDMTDEQINALFTLGAALGQVVTDGWGEVLRISDEAMQGITGQYNRQVDALEELVDKLGDGPESFEALADAASQMVTSFAQYAAHIGEIGRGLEDLIAGTNESFILATLSDEEKYNRFQQQAEDARALLSQSTNVDEIDRLTRLIDKLRADAFSLLSPEEQRARLPEFLAGGDSLNAEAQERLRKAAEEARERQEELLNGIRDRLDKVADKMNDSADTFIDAADTFDGAVNRGLRVVVVDSNGDAVGGLES